MRAVLIGIAGAAGGRPTSPRPSPSGSSAPFSTFSTFAVETDLFLRTYRVGTAALYLLVSLGVGVAAAAAGHRGAPLWTEGLMIEHMFV